MAELGPGPHRSGDIAAQLKRNVTSLAPTRGQLIRKGMIWSPSHGDTAFTVPLFDQFMHRIMPGDEWREWTLVTEIRSLPSGYGWSFWIREDGGEISSETQDKSVESHRVDTS